LQWITVRITKDLLRNEVKIPCLNHECTQEITMEEAFQNLDRKRTELVLDKLVNVYICNQSDIRSCPNSNCSNAGIITPFPCYESLECDCCNYKWKDISQYTWKDKLERAIFSNSTYKSNLLSYFSEIMKGEPCPE